MSEPVRCVWLAVTRRHVFASWLMLGACSTRAQESGNPAVVTLQSWWSNCPFLVLALLGAGASLAMLYRLKVRQLTHAQNRCIEDQLAEHVRIAGELHDTLLQGCQGLMFRLQAVRELLPTQPEKAVPILEETLLVGERAIDEARNAVRALRYTERNGHGHGARRSRDP